MWALVYSDTGDHKGVGEPFLEHSMQPVGVKPVHYPSDRLIKDPTPNISIPKFLRLHDPKFRTPEAQKTQDSKLL